MPRYRSRVRSAWLKFLVLAKTPLDARALMHQFGKSFRKAIREALAIKAL